jgi:hypothetical protein
MFTLNSPTENEAGSPRDPTTQARALLAQVVRLHPEDWSGADVLEAEEAIARDPAGWRDCFAAMIERNGRALH